MPLIVFEGIDGSGTTSQSRATAQRLRGMGHEAVWTCQPTKGPIGQFVRSVFELKVVEELPSWRTMMHLFQADAEMHQAQLREWLRDGNWVVCDRYWLSMLAYQGTSAVRAGADREQVRSLIIQLNEHMIEPDVTFVFDVAPQTGLLRQGDKQKDAYEKADFLEEVRQVYATAEGTSIHRFSTEDTTPDETAEKVDNVLQQWWAKHS